MLGLRAANTATACWRVHWRPRATSPVDPAGGAPPSCRSGLQDTRTPRARAPYLVLASSWYSRRDRRGVYDGSPPWT
jgi:hypothetical protein